jgi:hypothetical protein
MDAINGKSKHVICCVCAQACDVLCLLQACDVLCLCAGMLCVVYARRHVICFVCVQASYVLCMRAGM